MRLLALALLLSAAQVSDSEPIRVVLPPSVDAAACQVHSFLIGSFGGAGDYARPKRGDQVVQIPTINEERIVGRSLKAYVWCPGYEVWTLALDSLPVPAKRTITPVLTQRVSVRFAGVIRAWAAPPELLIVHVGYVPAWQCTFFGLMDCLIGPWPVAEANVRTDGSFVVDLPDFAGDRVIQSFGGAGDFSFTLWDKGNPKFELNPAGAASNHWRIAPRASYPAEQTFDLEPRR